MLHYRTLPVTAFQQNSSIVWCDETMDAAVIDPGGDLDALVAEVQRLGLQLIPPPLPITRLDTGITAAQLYGDAPWTDESSA